MSLLLQTDDQLRVISALGCGDDGAPEPAAPAGSESFLDRIDDRDREAVETAIRRGIEHSEDVVACGAPRVRDDQEMRPRTVTAALFFDRYRHFVGAAVTIADTAEAAGAVSELQARIQHQETLLHEVQHRVKNDMNFVQSLLTLQAHAAENASAKSSLLEAADRVLAVSRVYARLHFNHDVEIVDGKSLVHDLIHGLRESPLAASGDVLLESDDFAVPRRGAVSLGLILNELVTNAVKHGAHPSGASPIRVTIQNHAPRTVRITVHDRGPGFPEHILRGDGFGYGFTIIHALLDQNAETFHVWNDGGGVAEVRLAIAEGQS